jgi:hypothetical protein
MPLPRPVEIDTIYRLLKSAGLSVIDETEAVIKGQEMVASG